MDAESNAASRRSRSGFAILRLAAAADELGSRFSQVQGFVFVTTTAMTVECDLPPERKNGLRVGGGCE